MLVALTALFVALGGVSYAAVMLPANSVGRAQIMNNAVNYKKIAPNSVGIARINPNTVQARVLSTCASGHAAIIAIDAHGRPTCSGVLPGEFDTSSPTSVPVPGATPATVASEVLTGDTSYLVLASPQIVVTGTAGVAQHEFVTCTLASSPLVASQSRSATVDVAVGHESETVSIPLTLPITANSTTDTLGVSCSQTVTGPTDAAAPAVLATTTINAIQTGGNTTQADTATTTG
jgi:hypothetical protein